MNELDLVREFRAEVAPAELAHARRRLVREMREPAPRGRRRGWLIASSLAAALVAVGAVIVTHDQTRPKAADAATILHQAALAAEHEQIMPARPEQYVFIESVEDYRGETFDCKADQQHCTARRDPAARTARQVWLSIDGTHDGLLRTRPEQGSGQWNETPLPACRPGPTGGANAPVAVCGAAGAYLVDAPTDPAAMTGYLRKRANGGELFTAAGDLIREAYLPPASLAALFRAVAAIPGITVAPDAVDAAGRHGVSVGVDGHGYRNELIFDRNTLTYLGSRTVALRDGSVDGQSAQLRVAVVDGIRQVP